MTPFRVVIATLLALTCGCASTEGPASGTVSSTGPTTTQSDAKPRSNPSTKGRVLRNKESVLAPETGAGLMRSDRGTAAATSIAVPAATESAAQEPKTAASTPAEIDATRTESVAAEPPTPAGEMTAPSDAPAPQQTPAATASATESTSVAKLSPVRGISRPGGPIEVQVQAPEGHGPLSILVLDRAGNVQERISVTPGTVDLAPLASALERADRALWLQLAEDDRMIGTPLWFVPLRAAPPVRTVRSIRASTQQPYLRVVGWGDRAYDPQDSETAAAMPAWSAPDPIVTSGFRIEPAQVALLHTEQGTIPITFAPDAAPATVENFLRLARDGFFDGTTFHRVVPLDREGRPFVIQGGDPTGTGDGGPGWNLALEPSDLPHDRGVLGMARGDDPHSAGSQFYIALSREGTARLDGQYCTFAAMTDGWDTLDRIASMEIGDATTGRPAAPVRIDRVELLPAPARSAAPLWPGPPKPVPAEPVSPSPSPER